jgi:alanine racemase
MNPILEINLKNLNFNYGKLNRKFPNFWAVLKDNAYGLGISEVAFSLYGLGCRKFMVADLNEALEIKKAIKGRDYEVAVLNGFFSESDAVLFMKNNILPFLSTKNQINIWKKINKNGQFAIFAETGLNRFSLRSEELRYLLKNFKNEIRLVISHLACARNSDNPRNSQQKKIFDEVCSFIEKSNKILEKSLSSSEAAFNLDASYFYDSVRFGSALYGFSKDINEKFGLKNVVSFRAPIIKTFNVEKGEYISYGDDCILDKSKYIGILNLGLVNGFYRSMSNNEAFFYVKSGKKYEIPVIGRITMEYTTIDLSETPFIKAGNYINLFDYNNHIKDRLDNFNYEDILPRITSAQPLPYHKEFILFSKSSKNNIIYKK